MIFTAPIVERSMNTRLDGRFIMTNGYSERIEESLEEVLRTDAE